MVAREHLLQRVFDMQHAGKTPQFEQSYMKKRWQTVGLLFTFHRFIWATRPVFCSARAVHSCFVGVMLQVVNMSQIWADKFILRREWKNTPLRDISLCIPTAWVGVDDVAVDDDAVWTAAAGGGRERGLRGQPGRGGIGLLRTSSGSVSSTASLSSIGSSP